MAAFPSLMIFGQPTAGADAAQWIAAIPEDGFAR